MRIAVVCNDSRGGIGPYGALGLGLRRAGHDVRAAAPAELAPRFVDAGIPAAQLSARPEAVREVATGVAERDTFATIHLTMRELPARIRVWTRETLEACEGVDILTRGVGGTVVGLSAAQKLGGVVHRNAPATGRRVHGRLPRRPAGGTALVDAVPAGDGVGTGAVA